MLRRTPFTDDTRLERRIRELLRKLAAVNEAPGSSILKFGGGEHESAPPRAVREKVGIEKLRKVPRHRFLIDYYLVEFEQAAGDDQSLRITCVHAEIDLGERSRLPDRDEKQSVEEYEAEQVRVLIERGEGIHYIELATEEGWPAGWVRTVRERHGREPVYGRERPNWRELTDRQRRDLCRSMAIDDRLSIRDAASLIGVGKSTIARHWPAELKRAA